MNETLKPTQAKFIEFLKKSGIRQVREENQYQLIDGTYSPYYYDFGRVGSPKDLEMLGVCYAVKIQFEIPVDDFDILYGPAMKGISIVIATAAALSLHFGVDKPFFYDRPGGIKEYGAEDLLLGAEPRGQRVLILDDVFTHGTAKYNAVGLVLAQGAIPMGVLSGVDRSENSGSVQRFTGQTGLPVWSIVSDEQVVNYDPSIYQTI